MTDTLAWDDLEPAPAGIFRTWSWGSEVEWAKHAWSALAEAKLTEYDNELERVTVVLRLLALGAIYTNFCAYAFEEGTDGGWRDELRLDLTDAVDMFSLGQLAGQRGVHVCQLEQGDDDGIRLAVVELIEHEYRTVADTLVKQWGDATLFASLWLSNTGDTSYPLSTDQITETVNDDLTAGKHTAYSWISGGLTG